jgi:hypothetical protein
MRPDPNDSSLRKLQKDRGRERNIYIAKLLELIRIGKWNSQDFNILIPVPAQLAENLLELMEKDEDKVN